MRAWRFRHEPSPSSRRGQRYEREVEPRRTLADFLREDLGLKGTHLACEHGFCGNCNVLVDGAALRSCLMFAVQADGRSIETVESLAGPGGELDGLQRAFTEHHALQCGFCTPAMLLTATEFLREHPGETDELAIREAISGVLCRCTGYQQIVDAIQAVARAQQTPHSLSPTQEAT
jgi:aerobic carbon-monoxide dehydrogenase small subunit